MENYQIVLHKKTYQKASNYLKSLKKGEPPGKFLQAQLAGRDPGSLTVEDLIELLIQTKQPQIFAESSINGDGSDWYHRELSILGDISIVVPVEVFDNGRHYGPEVHPEPFPATLIFVPGALLRNGRNNTPADWEEVTRDDEIDEKAYYKLYERRLLPGLMYISEQLARDNKPGLITIPGLGCGQFAGPFRGQLGEILKNTLMKMLETHGANLAGVKAVYYDPYNECRNERFEIHGISFFVRPLTQGNDPKSQLAAPPIYAEAGDDFSECRLFSFVAWDHVSWPGNDFYLGNRMTDDGVKAAATSSMRTMTGLAGSYDRHANQYKPPAGYQNWVEVVTQNNLQIQFKDNLHIYSVPGVKGLIQSLFG